MTTTETKASTMANRGISARPGGGPSAILRKTGRTLTTNAMLALLVVLVAVITIIDQSFLSPTNIVNLALQWAPVGVMAVAMTFVVIGGGFDLSVGGTYAMSAVVFATMSGKGVPIWLAIVVSLGVGVLVGLINGYLIAFGGINPFVVTLGSGYVIRGVALVMTAGAPVTLSDPSFLALGSGELLGVPIPVWLMLLVFCTAGVMLKFTIFGREIYAVGGGLESSRLSGLRVHRIRISTYVISGLAAALGGMVIAARLTAGDASTGTGIELQVITVVLAGGIALSGGEGAVWKAAVGLAILATLGNAFDLLQISTFWQSVVTGTILVAAVALDALAPRTGGRAEMTRGIIRRSPG